MRSHDVAKHQEAVEASWEAARGATYGAVKWGIATALLGGVGYAMSPLYRGLTVQFKVYVLHYLLCTPTPLLTLGVTPAPRTRNGRGETV